jgi:hypothetical protein
MPLPAGGKDSVADEIISVEVQAQPLGEVLADISEATGYQFSIHESWADFPITTSFKDEPMHQGLKKILRRLNNAIIYGSDGTIKILIYGEISSSATASRPPASERLIRETIQPPVSRLRPPLPQTLPSVSGQQSDYGSDESSSRDDSESVAESADSSDVQEEQNDEEGETGDQSASEPLEPPENETAAENDADGSEETESSSEEPGNSEDEESASEIPTN